MTKTSLRVVCVDAGAAHETTSGASQIVQRPARHSARFVEIPLVGREIRERALAADREHEVRSAESGDSREHRRRGFRQRYQELEAGLIAFLGDDPVGPVDLAATHAAAFVAPGRSQQQELHIEAEQRPVAGRGLYGAELIVAEHPLALLRLKSSSP